MSKEVRGIADTNTQLAKELQEVRSLHRDLMATVEKLASIVAKAEDNVCNAPPAPPPAQPQPSLPSKPTYTSTVMRMLPPTHATSLARQDAQF